MEYGNYYTEETLRSLNAAYDTLYGITSRETAGHTHQPFLRQHMGGGGPPLSGTQDRKGRQRPYGKHHYHLHGQHPFTS